MKNHLKSLGTWIQTKRTILGWAAAFLAIYLGASSLWPSDARSVSSDLVLILTALVVVWYTAETAEIRKQGKRRANIEAAPVVGLELPRRVPSEPEPNDPAPFWFSVRNYTRNPATLRVFLRLNTTAGCGRLTTGPYSGNEDWHLPEFQVFSGWFSMGRLLATTQQQEPRVSIQALFGQPAQIVWPADPKMQLDIQVGIYDAERRLRRVLHQEYAVVWKSVQDECQLWPETAPKTLEHLKWPDTLPEGALQL